MIESDVIILGPTESYHGMPESGPYALRILRHALLTNRPAGRIDSLPTGVAGSVWWLLRSIRPAGCRDSPF